MTSACVDALCWIKNGQKPERDKILSTGINQNFLWASFDCLAIQDGLLYRQVGPLIDGYSLMSSKPKERADQTVSRHQDGWSFLLLEDTEEGQVLFQLGRHQYRRESLLPSLPSVHNMQDGRT